MLPCSLLNTCVNVFAPAIVKLANLSLQTGIFPSCYKRAQVLPLLKKAGPNTSLPGNYRPMSNLGTISKVIREACILARLHPHLLGIPGISASSSRHTGNSIRRRPHCWKSWTVRTRQPMTSKSPFSSASTYLQPLAR